MRDGLTQIRAVTLERLQSHQSAIILIFGDQGVGKSSLARIIETTQLGITLSSPPLVHVDDQHPESERFVYHLNRGELPGRLPSLTVFTRLNSSLVPKNYGVDREVIFVEMTCDPETQIQNLTDRGYQRAREVGLPYSREGIRSALLASPPDLVTLVERINSGTYSDILLDSSAKNRISLEDARNFLSNPI